MNYYIIQDGTSDNELWTRESATDVLESIAEAMESDAGKIRKMATHFRKTGEIVRYDGAYLALEVRPDND